MIRRARIKGRKAGLSLFELLIALALLAAISTALAASMGFAVRIYDRTEKIDADDTPVAARLHLRHWITMATPPALLTPFPSGFKGDSASLSFTTLAPVGFAPDAAAMRVAVSQAEGDLVMALEPMDDDGTPLSRLSVVLAEDASALAIDYFDISADPPNWRGDWPAGTPSLPAAIRITLDEGSTPDWPDFIVRPRLLATP